MGQDDAEFELFVATHGPGLLAFARALAPTRSDAEDLMQSALTSAYARWPHIRVDEALAYVRRSIANGRVSLWRRRSSRDVLGFEADVVSSEHHDEDTVERLAVRAVLLSLPRGTAGSPIVPKPRAAPQDQSTSARRQP